MMMINRRRVCGGKNLPQGAVDMGLPSGTLWAQGNIVKDANDNYAIGEPTDYGCYFSWGNIDCHNEFSVDAYSFSSGNYALTQGCQLTNNIATNDTEHDAAVARLGGGWHMPTINNFTELLNNSYTTRRFVSINGVKYLQITSISNGNTLYLIGSGFIKDKWSQNKKDYGYYFSSTMVDTNSAKIFHFNASSVYFLNYNRYYGLSIRPVITI